MVVNILANIILQENFTIKTVKLNQNETYDLSELTFYIPNKFNCSHIFVLITDSTLTDIVPLQYDGSYQSYKTYKMNYANTIRVKPGLVKLSILLYDGKQENALMSNGSIKFNANIENYKIAHQLAITMELNTALKETYNKIMELTTMNIDIYEKMMEANNT